MVFEVVVGWRGSVTALTLRVLVAMTALSSKPGEARLATSGTPASSS